MKNSELLKAFRYVWKNQRIWVLFSALISLFMGLIPITNLWVVKELINEVAAVLGGAKQEYTASFLLLLAQFALLFVSSAVLKGQELLDKQTEIKLDHDLQQMVMQKTSSAPLAFYDVPAFHDTIERVYTGHGIRFMQPVKNIFEIGRYFTTLLSFFAFLLSVHWGLVLVSLAGSIPVLLVLVRFGNQRFHLRFHQTPLAREASYLKHLLIDRQAAKEVRLFQMKEFLLRGWSDKYRKNSQELLKLTRREKLAMIGMDGLTALFYVSAAGLIIWLARTTKVTIGDFVALGQAVQGTQGAMNGIVTHLARIHETRLYIREFFQFIELDLSAYEIKRGTAPFPRPLETGITVDNLSFCYPGSERYTLRNVSFSISPGERIAIVGENGSGKTTLVKCLMGLYRLSEGQIRFDGLPLEEIGESEFFRNLTVIFQDFMHYDFTVRENISIGQLEAAADLERVKRAAQKSGADRFVQRMADGYDTYLGRSFRDGEDLSGGQWQKVALARALFSDGQVIILDEPTAALDPRAEMEVFQKFDQLTQNSTAVFISHRMAAARMADRILVMKDGALLESGSHEELMALGGEYQRMYDMQAKWYV
ncbi:ABC transporter ATP-binding protein [Tumebacillus avium]|nr:ABC transporter ATP-binding protein [Tumebacillus avium]